MLRGEIGAMKAAGILRVSSEIEDMGMDDSKHGGNIMNTAVPKEA